LPNGAAIYAGPATGDAWVLAEGQPARTVGAALAWAIRQGATRLHLLLSAPAATTEVAGVVARRAGLFAMPVDVWLADGRQLEPVAAAPPDPAERGLPPGLDPMAERIRAAGAEPVYEHGGLTGEVLGLEVCRVVSDETGGPHLTVGVGKYDREVHEALLAGDDGPGLDDGLRRVIDSVRKHRRAGAATHPANQLATERWLRAALVRHPEWAGARFLRPVPTTEPRTDLRQPAPAAAIGDDDTGQTILVVCTAGTVDLEAVPVAADTRLARSVTGPPRLVVALDPPADARITRDLAGALRQPATVTVVPAEWRGVPG
jgi:hypothetical protein